MENSNVSIVTIQRILGHENRSTTEVYLHSIGDSEKKAMAILDQTANFFKHKISLRISSAYPPEAPGPFSQGPGAFQVPLNEFPVARTSKTGNRNSPIASTTTPKSGTFDNRFPRMNPCH